MISYHIPLDICYTGVTSYVYAGIGTVDKIVHFVYHICNSIFRTKSMSKQKDYSQMSRSDKYHI